MCLPCLELERIIDTAVVKGLSGSMYILLLHLVPSPDTAGCAWQTSRHLILWQQVAEPFLVCAALANSLLLEQ